MEANRDSTSRSLRLLLRGSSELLYAPIADSGGEDDVQRRDRSVLGALVVSLCVAVGAPDARAQDRPQQSPIVAYRLADGEEIRVDGRLDDAAWGAAIPVSDFTQQVPIEGGTPSERTIVRIAFDANDLYIGVMLYDDPDRIIANQRERDAFLFSDDKFAWVLDTFNNGRTGYNFEVNPAGAMTDGLITGSGGGRGGGGGGMFGGVNRSWDGIWDARTQRLPDGWSAEIRIPFRTLNFDPSADSWGINFQRSIERRQEEILWRGFRRNEGLNRLVNAGTLTGLGGMTQGIGLEAVPSAIASWQNTPANEDPNEFPVDVSLDLNYSVTSSLRASVSFNTDFAEVEADERRVNLTRFPLFFPERRDFFLEGSSAFTFAPSSGPSPFFSRRIGLNGGEQIPIRIGARVTGQVGSREIGFYQMRTGSHVLLNGTRLEPEDFTVARLKQQFFEQSTFGVVYTRRATLQDSTGFAPADRHTVGVDLDMRTRSFLGDNNLEFEAFYVWNSDPQPDRELDPGEERPSWGDLTARGLRLNFPNDIWSGHVSYREFGEDYRPAVGFVSRNGFRRVEPRIGWSPRPSWGAVRQVSTSVQYRGLWQLGTGILEERQWQFDVLNIDFESGDNVSFQATNTFEFLEDDFEISDGILVETGEYENWEYQVRGRTASRRFVSIFGGVSWGGFWDGTRTRIDGRVFFRPAPGIGLSTEVERNDVSLSGGDFTTNVYRFEGGFDPSPWVGFTSQLQYDNQSEIIGLFARLRWILTPGNDVFLVYTHNWQDFGADMDVIPNPNEEGFRTLSRGATIKLNYTYRF